MCQCVYNGLNFEIREIVEFMSNYEFQWLAPEYAWNYFEWLFDNTYNWEMTIHKTCQTLIHPALTMAYPRSVKECLKLDSLLTEFFCINF